MLEEESKGLGSLSLEDQRGSEQQSPEAIAEEDTHIESDVNALKGVIVRNSGKSGKEYEHYSYGIELEKEADPHRVANGIVMEINHCAAQLF